jgi:F0F1-type ATP synthase assembly protein I
MPRISTPKPPQKSSWPEAMRSVAQYTHLGWTLVASVGLSMLVGRWADARLGTDPWLFIIGAFLGILLGLYC